MIGDIKSDVTVKAMAAERSTNAASEIFPISKPLSMNFEGFDFSGLKPACYGVRGPSINETMRLRTCGRVTKLVYSF